MHSQSPENFQALGGPTILLRQPNGRVDCHGPDYPAVARILASAGLEPTVEHDWLNPNRVLSVQVTPGPEADTIRFARVHRVLAASSSGPVITFDFRESGIDVEPHIAIGEQDGHPVAPSPSPTLIIVEHVAFEHRQWFFLDPFSLPLFCDLADSMGASYRRVDIGGTEYGFLCDPGKGRQMLKAVRAARQKDWMVRRLHAAPHPAAGNGPCDPGASPLTPLAIRDCEPLRPVDAEVIEANQVQAMTLAALAHAVRARFVDGLVADPPDGIPAERAVPYLMELTEMLLRSNLERYGNPRGRMPLAAVSDLLGEAITEAADQPERANSAIRLFREWVGLDPRTDHCDYPAAVDCVSAALILVGSSDGRELKDARFAVVREQMAIPRFLRSAETVTSTRQVASPERRVRHPSDRRPSPLLDQAVVLVRHENGYIHCHGTDYAAIEGVLAEAGFFVMEQADPFASDRIVDVTIPPSGDDGDDTLLERAHAALAAAGSGSVVAFDFFYDLHGDGPPIKYAIAHEEHAVFPAAPFLLMVEYSGESQGTWFFTDSRSLSQIRSVFEATGQAHWMVESNEAAAPVGIAVPSNSDLDRIYRTFRGRSWAIASLSFSPSREPSDSDMSDALLTPLDFEGIPVSEPDTDDDRAYRRAFRYELQPLVNDVRSRFVEDVDPAVSSHAPRDSDGLHLMALAQVLLRSLNHRGPGPERVADPSDVADRLGEVIVEVYDLPERAEVAASQYREWMGLTPRTGHIDYAAAVDAVAAALFLVGSNDAAELEDAAERVVREHTAISPPR